MRALTVRQPWAELVASGVKSIETRTWATRYRGRLAIHAAQQDDRAAMDGKVAAAEHHLVNHRPPDGKWPRGAFVATATLTDCRPLTPADEAGACTLWSPGRYAWILRDVRRLEVPLPCKGRLGLWTPDSKTMHALENA